MLFCPGPTMHISQDSLGLSASWGQSRTQSTKEGHAGWSRKAGVLENSPHRGAFLSDGDRESQHMDPVGSTWLGALSIFLLGKKV